MIKEGFHFLHLIYEVQLINTKEEQCSVQQHIVNDVAQEKRTTLILKKKKKNDWYLEIHTESMPMEIRSPAIHPREKTVGIIHKY